MGDSVAPASRLSSRVEEVKASLGSHIFSVDASCGRQFQFHVLFDVGWVLHWHSHCLEAWLTDIIEEDGWLDQRRKLLRQRAGLSDRDTRKVWCSMERGLGCTRVSFFHKPFQSFSILQFQITSTILKLDYHGRRCKPNIQMVTEAKGIYIYILYIYII